MKIGIDYREAVREKRAGKGIVVFELVRAMREIVEDDEVVLYSNIAFDMTGWPTNFTQKIIRLPDIFFHFRMMGEIWWGVDKYLALTSFLAPAMAMSNKAYIMVHDMVAFLPEFSQHHNQKALWLERASLGWALKWAGGVIVPSQATRDDLIRLTKVKAEKIYYLAEGFNYIDDNSEPVNKIDDEYIFFVSTLEPRKNLVRLMGAVRRLIDRGWRGKVVLAGKKGWYGDVLDQAVEQYGLTDVVIFLGYVTDQEKFALMRRAKILYAVSLYEGFGLPVLEGMASGVPVLTANRSSLPEVAGEAAGMVDPLDEEAIADHIWQIWNDKELARAMVERGRIWYRQFSWSKMAEEVYQLLGGKTEKKVN